MNKEELDKHYLILGALQNAHDMTGHLLAREYILEGIEYVKTLRKRIEKLETTNQPTTRSKHA